MHGSVSDFDCNYALEILMRRLTNELVMHVALTPAKSPSKPALQKVCHLSSLSTDADVN